MTERERQYDHEYYLKNRERILARVKSYYQVNKEDIGFCQKVRPGCTCSNWCSGGGQLQICKGIYG